MNRKLTVAFLFGFVLTFVSLTNSAIADPLPGRDLLKFSQLPMDGTPIVSVDPASGAVVTELYYGHDEFSTAYATINVPGGPPQTPYVGQFMADDFADRFSSPVVHVKWWGSYLNNNIQQPVDKFLISFESDVPDPDGPHEGPGFSRPGTPLLNQIVTKVPVGGITPGSGTFTEVPISPGGAPLFEELYEYNAELHFGKEFFQEPDKVYWLKIVALVDLPPGIDPQQNPTAVTRWGWHNRDYTVPNPLASVPPAVDPGEHLDNPFVDPFYPAPVYHFQDNSVTGRVVIDPHNDPIMPEVFQDEALMMPNYYLDDIDGPGPGLGPDGAHEGIGQFSKDLAFELYTVPEPSTLGLMLIGLVAFRLRVKNYSI